MKITTQQPLSHWLPAILIATVDAIREGRSLIIGWAVNRRDPRYCYPVRYDLTTGVIWITPQMALLGDGELEEAGRYWDLQWSADLAVPAP